MLPPPLGSESSLGCPGGDAIAGLHMADLHTERSPEAGPALAAISGALGAAAAGTAAWSPLVRSPSARDRRTPSTRTSSAGQGRAHHSHPSAMARDAGLRCISRASGSAQRACRATVRADVAASVAPRTQSLPARWRRPGTEQSHRVPVARDRASRRPCALGRCARRAHHRRRRLLGRAPEQQRVEPDPIHDNPVLVIRTSSSSSAPHRTAASHHT